MFNGFQVLWSSCYLVRLVLSSSVLSRVSCYLVRLVLSCVIWFGLQRVCRCPILLTYGAPRRSGLISGRANGAGKSIFSISAIVYILEARIPGMFCERPNQDYLSRSFSSGLILF
jgi:hypothetical protein